MTAAAVSAVAAVIAAAVTGWFALLARRAAAHAPESVAGGYSRLVADMRSQHDLLQQRVNELEHEMEEYQRKTVALSLKVRWLLDNAAPESRAEFREQFPEHPKR